MNYVILIIVGIAGIVLGTYLGRRRVIKKGKPRNVHKDALRGKLFDETQDKERESTKKKRENLVTHI